MATVKYMLRTEKLDRLLLKHETDIIPPERYSIKIKGKNYMATEFEYHPRKKGTSVTVYVIKR
jgi:sRNA-binding regulator protein Hfq